jgi:hypothetical protein
MLLNSFQLILFFAVVFRLYAALPRRGQNVLLVAASMVVNLTFLGLF